MLLNNTQHLNMVLALGNKYHHNQLHAKTVERSAVTIFKLLQEFHGLGESELNLLRHGALLHDLGTYISVKRHHRHSAYLVLHDQDFDVYPPKARELLAILVKNHRRPVKLEAKLAYSEQVILSKLIAILRIADALDYLHYGNVQITSINIEANQCTFKVENAGLEIIHEKVVSKAEYFTEAFKMQAIFTKST
ncbi:MAG: HD domain-containing protein [Desulfotomaculum sp.]|nr:HD domain-containing protein [Desulfotomaculum sp.]